MGKRMYYVFKIILENQSNGISAKEILKKLEKYEIYINIKTVRTCIQNINDFFYEWIHEDIIVAIKSIGYRIQTDFFEDGELQFILDSIVFHQDLKNEDKHILQNKLLSLSSYSQQLRLVRFEPSKRTLQFSLFLNLTTIMKAIENKSVISFQYINYTVQYNHLKEVPSQNGNKNNQYIISPYQIVSQNNHYYVIGYNDKFKNELSTYRIDRMRLIQTIHHHYLDIREQFDLTDEIEKTTNMYISQQRATIQLECHQKLLRELVSRFGTEIEVQKLYQQQYLITITDTPISDGLIGWLMMLQDQVKVIAPESLQQEMKNRIEKMRLLYLEK